MRKAEQMSMSDRINTCIDTGLKKKVVKIFERLGLTEAEAIRLFYAQVVFHQGIPFSLMIPNAHKRDAFEEAKHPEKLPRLRTFAPSEAARARKPCFTFQPDWLLIYRIEATFLILERTGTHSDLFD